MKDTKALLGRRELNGMKRIFLEYSSLLLVWEFKWERIEWVGGNTHYSLFPKNLKFSFPMKLRGM